MSTRAEAWSRFTARISHEAAKAGSQIFCLLLGVLLSACGAQTPKQASFKPRAEHVVLCVWDGMRPDFITPAGTPVLHALIQRGTLFANNHSQYVTTTEVNGTVLATGVFPARSGIVANREFRREIDPLRSIATESVVAIRKGDELSGGKYLGVPTIAEMLQRAGVRTAIAGSKPVTLLHNRNFGLNGQTDSPILFAGKCYPPLLMPEITAVLGPFPELSPTDVLEEDVKPNTAQNAWTTRALTEVFWKEGVPKFSLLWLNDPDFAQHMTAPGSPAALAGASDSDRNLGLVLAALEAKGLRDKTDIFVVSDHGFSTVSQSINVVNFLRASGIQAAREFRWAPRAGEVLVANSGGSTAIYVVGQVPEVIQKIVDLLQASDFAGPIFTRNALPGTFAFRDLHIDSPSAPDIVFGFRTLPGNNRFGAPGLIWGEIRDGYGTHGTLGKADVQNVLVAAGPDIRAGFRNLFPSGNIDVVPTLLHLLGIQPAEPLDGRILTEALAAVDWDAPAPQAKRMEASRVLGTGTWRQFVETTEFAGRVYFDEGNAALEPGAGAK